MNDKRVISCVIKNVFYSESEAISHAKYMKDTFYVYLKPYTCPICRFFHLTSQYKKSLTSVRDDNRRKNIFDNDLIIEEKIFSKTKRKENTMLSFKCDRRYKGNSKNKYQ